MMEQTGKKERILIVDDEEFILQLMKDTLEFNNYDAVAVSDPLKVPDLIKTVNPDTIISDINMPKLDGLTLLKIVKEHDPKLPVIIITGSTDMENLMTSFRLGAFDYLKKPFSMNELIITVGQAVHKRELQRELDEHYQLLEVKVKEKTRELSEANKKLEANLLKATLAMVNALDANDKYTKGHSERVATISLLMAREMGYDEETCKNLRLGAVLHDIGKIGITHNILHKPTKLTRDEYEVMKTHPSIGLNITRPIDLAQDVFDIVGQHHERVDGGGYPSGLKGEQISPLARIVSVADAFDAITSDRPYRKRFSSEYAVKEILSLVDAQFDREAANALNRVYPEIDSAVRHGLSIDDMQGEQ